MMKYVLSYDSLSKILKVTDPRTRFVYRLGAYSLIYSGSLGREIRKAIDKGRRRLRREHRLHDGRTL